MRVGLVAIISSVRFISTRPALDYFCLWYDFVVVCSCSYVSSVIYVSRRTTSSSCLFDCFCSGPQNEQATTSHHTNKTLIVAGMHHTRLLLGCCTYDVVVGLGASSCCIQASACMRIVFLAAVFLLHGQHIFRIAYQVRRNTPWMSYIPPSCHPCIMLWNVVKR